MDLNALSIGEDVAALVAGRVELALIAMRQDVGAALAGQVEQGEQGWVPEELGDDVDMVGFWAGVRYAAQLAADTNFEL